MAVPGIIRWPNLLIIILTQYLLRYGIMNSFLFRNHPAMASGVSDFTLLVLATLLITTGGYIINDYFDARIDSVNKPRVNPVGNVLSRRGAIRIHIVINAIAVLIGFYLAFRIHSLNFGLIFPFAGIILWLYSARYKRMTAWGNIIVSILSALVVFMVWYFEFLNLRLHPSDFSGIIPELKQTSMYFAAIGLFAFLVTFFREIIKDMEDIPGDQQYGCRTIPIILGVKKTKTLVTVIICLTILLVCLAQWVFLNSGRVMVFWYCTGLIQAPMVYLIYKLYKSGDRDDFHFLSNLCKVIMFAGVLSMQLLSTGV